MAVCQATKKDGQPCVAHAGKNGSLCYFHDPAHGAERAAARKLGGLRRRAGHGGGDVAALPPKVRTLADVLMVLDYTLAECLPLENSIARGRLLVAIAGEFTKAIQVGELEARLLAIENALKLREQ
jgi:hypothetical protein